MEFLGYLSIALIIIWCLSEVAIRAFSRRNRSKSLPGTKDKFSLFLIWLCIVPTVGFALLIRFDQTSAIRFGNLSNLYPFMVILGCILLAAGIIIRIIAVATLNTQFTIQVSIQDKHELVENGIYRQIRHPAYLGLLLSLFGIGLISENWVGMILLTVLPLAAILYRIQVEEIVLSQHFGAAWLVYAGRTKKLIPGIW
jgi:protein-S-isoprenylcysteine O-methyltransferase Ste14